MAERRTRLSPEERRAQIVALGVAALADHPIEHLTMDRLAQDAGVSRALLFHYFGGVQGLHHAIVLTARDAMLRASEPQLELAPLERLHDTLARLVRFVRDHPRTFYSLVRGAASGDPEVRVAVDEAREVHTDRVIHVFVEIGVHDTATLRIGLRAWVAFVEQALVDAAVEPALPEVELVELLQRSARAVVATFDEVSA